MRRTIACLVLVAFSSLATGCFKATYLNLYSEDYTIPEGSPATNFESDGWRNFFIFGQIPGELVIDARRLCGEGHVAEIETRWTFLQVVLTGVSTAFFVNLYSPITGKVICDSA